MSEKPELEGWLLDLYADHEGGVVVWLLGVDGGRHKLHHDFPISFFAGGQPSQLRLLWQFLRTHPTKTVLAKREKQTVDDETKEVLEISVHLPSEQPRLLLDIVNKFPDLDFFDTDIPLFIRYSAQFGIFPFARVIIQHDSQGEIKTISSPDNRFELATISPPFRVMRLHPDTDPNHERPTNLCLEFGEEEQTLPLANGKELLTRLNTLLTSFDPDFIITNWGDDRIFAYLQKLSEQHNIPFNPNRDTSRSPAYRKPHSYRQYGRIMYRGAQTHLFGRFHIDRHNAMTYGEYGLRGAIRQSRVTCLPVQEIARKSPGAGITAMFMYTAQKRGMLYPHTKLYVERPKSIMQLDLADQGGLVMKPTIGLHTDVVQIDFSSMYPSIMALWNVSPEMVGVVSKMVKLVPDLNLPVDQTREGLVSETLKPLLALRLKMKAMLETLEESSLEHQIIKAESTALKWLLVVCFGYQGYERFKLGRIEAHETVTAISRHLLRLSAETANALGYQVLHMYVDGLWVKKRDGKSVSRGEVGSLLAKVTEATGLPIAVEAHYRWIAFLSSREEERDPVPNRYFGQKMDDGFKVRGISSRRHDTPNWVAQGEGLILETLGKSGSSREELTSQVPAVLENLRAMIASLKAKEVPIEDLIVNINLSKSPADYRVKTAGARAGLQLQRQGRKMSPGERIRFVYTKRREKVSAWDLRPAPTIDEIDTGRYIELLLRTASELLSPFGVKEDLLTKAVLYDLDTPMLPVFANRQKRTELISTR